MKKFTFFTIIVLSAFTLKAQLNAGTGLYEFADETDIFKNTAVGTGVGTIMCEGVFKFNPDATDTNLDDMVSIELTDYMSIDGINNKAIALKAHNWLKIWHGIPANGGGSFVNDFTIVMDVRVSNDTGIFSLVEVNPTPTLNGFTSEIEIADLKVGSIGAPSSSYDALGFSDNTLEVDTWYRITYAAKLSEFIKVYVDGVLWLSKEGNFTDARPAPYGADTDPDKAALKICGNNESAPANDPPRDGDKDVDMLAIFASTLTDAEIQALGVAGDGTVDVKQVFAKENTVRLFPNPAQDVLNVVVSDYAHLDLINTIGQIVNSYSIDKNSSINVSHLNKGVYFARITDNNGNVSAHKLIVE